MCGMRIKASYTFSAARIIARLFICGCLKKKELPMGSHFVLEIEELRVIGGAPIGN